MLALSANETASSYVLCVIAMVFILPAIPVWDIQNSAFFLYSLISNVLMLGALVVSPRSAIVAVRFRRDI
jgi:hypothetical protein